MSGEIIGDHDPVFMSGGPGLIGSSLGVWVECECGWISPGYFTADAALRSHERHEKKVSES